jgi:hypothetical protein
MKQFFQFLPGDLVEMIYAKDQSPYFRKMFVGKLGVIERKMTKEQDGEISSPNMYKVFVDNRILHLHCLDMKLLSRVE